MGEEESRRGVYEKHFRMSDGSYTAATYDLPVHYFDGSVYREIDNTLERVTVSGKTVYRTRSNSFIAEMPTSVASGNEIVLKKGSATLSFGMDNAVSVRSGEVSNSVDRVKDVASAEKISLAANASEISGYIDVENELREEMTEASGTDAVLKSNLLKQSAEIRTSEITYGIAGGTTAKKAAKNEVKKAVYKEYKTAQVESLAYGGLNKFTTFYFQKYAIWCFDR